MTSTPRERLTDAAFALFAERGFHETTVDDVVARAGVGRTTFFRAFSAKEDVIFPDHEALVAQVQERLAASSDAPALAAASDAAGLVLEHYLAEGDRARLRYRITRQVAALRDREAASQLPYHRAFRVFLRDLTGESEASDLRAELLAGAVVTAHNHVLRRWLRGHTEADAARAELGRAMAEVALWATPSAPTDLAPVQETAIVVVRSTRPVDELLPALRAAAAEPGAAHAPGSTA
ncbi:TetR family transcriptional regulator [Arthrobacter sp. NEB 688]|uniref:TetR family transcriptional regulator n=1 Tax=Arthrobacter sp. NEB 688 TaxID=904039 RepID=UPI0015632520|nr:TetR family transcriptional regulator [Arthrobacter sp. NEB 688]QKE85556.1 TetR family transcriptional regulator [Arthrobacter sp. NEB 688]